MAQRDAIEAELLGREPDYTLFIVITSSHRSIHDVLCKVFLPETFNGQPFLLLEPTKEQKPQLFHLFEFSIEGRIGSLETEISAKTAYARAGKGRQWGSDIAEYVMIAEPQDLEIRRFLNGERKGLDVPVCGSFALTPSILLGPDFINKYHFDGNVQREVVRELSFTLAAGPKLTFANQFTYSERPEGTLAIRELAARFSEPLSISSLEDVISDLDDLLLLTSFAERHRCVCVGWSLVNDKILIQRYRRNIVIPVKSKVFLNSTLVDLYCSNEFLVAAYRRFKELEPKGPIRHGLYGTLPLHDRTMESSVLSMFLALESLTLFLEDRTTLNLYYPKENGRNLNESSERGSRLSSTSGINPSIEVWFTARSKN